MPHVLKHLPFKHHFKIFLLITDVIQNFPWYRLQNRLEEVFYLNRLVIY